MSPIRQRTEGRRRDELRERERGKQETDHQGRRAESLCVEREKRNDDAEADEIHEDREEDDEERARHAG